MKIAKRKSQKVELAIELAITKMKDEGVLCKGTTWKDIRQSETMSVYLLDNDDAVFGVFPNPIGIVYGNLSLSAKGTPFLFLVDKDLPLEGEIMHHAESGAVYYLFFVGDEDDENDGYLIPHGEWTCCRDGHGVHYESVKESGI